MSGCFFLKHRVHLVYVDDLFLFGSLYYGVSESAFVFATDFVIYYELVNWLLC